jgi:hypothetical protein
MLLNIIKIYVHLVLVKIVPSYKDTNMKVLAFDIGTKTLSLCLLQDTQPPSNPLQDTQPPSNPLQDAQPPSNPLQDTQPPSDTSSNNVNYIIHLWETINIHIEAGVAPKAKPTMKEDAEYMISALASRVHGWMYLNPEAILIEQQPAGGTNRFSSVRMKILSHVVHAFFITEMTTGRITKVPVTFVSPASKLSGMVVVPEQPKDPTDAASSRRSMNAKYRANKQHAVNTTRSLLATCMDRRAPSTADALQLFASTRKKDDLSDAFLLARAFISKHKINN